MELVLDLIFDLITGAAGFLLTVIVLIILGVIAIIVFLRVEKKKVFFMALLGLGLVAFVLVGVPLLLGLLQCLGEGTCGEPTYYVDYTITLEPQAFGPPTAGITLASPVREGFPFSSFGNQPFCVLFQCIVNNLTVSASGPVNRTNSHGTVEVNLFPVNVNGRFTGLVAGSYRVEASFVEGTDVVTETARLVVP